MATEAPRSHADVQRGGARVRHVAGRAGSTVGLGRAPGRAWPLRLLAWWWRGWIAYCRTLQPR